MMQKRTNIIPLVLLLVCVATAGGWWWLHGRREALRQELRQSRNENASLAARRKELQQRFLAVRAAQIPEDQLSPAERRRLRVAKVVEQIKDERARRTAPLPPLPLPPPEGPSGNVFPELMEDPEYARLAMIIWNYGWLAHNARLFQWAGVPPEKQKRLYDLIVEVGFANDDALMAARKNGMGKEEAWKVRQKTMTECEADIAELIGAEAYAKFSRGRELHGVNEFVKKVEARLSYSDTPLTEEQARELFAVAIEAQTSFMIKPEQAKQLVERARTVLNPAQLEGFRQVVTEYNYGRSSVPAQ